MDIIGSFGRPGMLGNPIDDLANGVIAKIDASAQHVADVAYNEIHARFEQDKGQLATEMVAEAKPRVQTAVYEILDDPQTHARFKKIVDDSVTEAVAAAKPLSQAAIYQILDDPKTHDRINGLVDSAVSEAQPKLMRSAVPLAAAVVLGTAAVTWAMVTFLTPGKHKDEG